MKYEQELKIKLLEEEIKALRISDKLTQDQLGESVGVQRAQISKLEIGKSIITLGTVLKVMNALKAKVSFEQFSLSFVK